jgi:hypothetical protein
MSGGDRFGAIAGIAILSDCDAFRDSQVDAEGRGLRKPYSLIAQKSRQQISTVEYLIHRQRAEY